MSLHFDIPLIESIDYRRPPTTKALKKAYQTMHEVARHLLQTAQELKGASKEAAKDVDIVEKVQEIGVQLGLR